MRFEIWSVLELQITINRTMMMQIHQRQKETRMQPANLEAMVVLGQTRKAVKIEGNGDL